MGRIRRLLFASYLGNRRRLSGHGLGRVPGAKTFRDVLYRCLRECEVLEIQTNEGRFFANTRDEGIVPYLLSSGSYDRDSIAVLKASLRPGMRVADIGANIGLFTVTASKMVGPTGEVYAFEPEPENFGLLVRNVALNGCKNVRCLQVAVAETTGMVDLYRDPLNLGNHSLCQRNVTKNGPAAVTVRSRSLDSIIMEADPQARVDLVKVDVQGAEGKVLRGARRVLSGSGCRILMEFWPKGLENFGADPRDLLQELCDLGFWISIINEDGLRSVVAAGLERLATLKDYPGADHVNLFLQKSESNALNAR